MIESIRSSYLWRRTLPDLTVTDRPFDDISPLARRNGIELSATRWSTDVERLIKELERVLK